MIGTKLIRDHHLLTRNLKLNDKYISNDGGDEGIHITDDGLIKFAPRGLSQYEFDYNTWKLTSIASPYGYFYMTMDNGNGKTGLKTVDPTGSQADLYLEPDGDIGLYAGATNKVFIDNTTKTSSQSSDASLHIQETIDLSSGAGGSDVHYGIWYAQTQTNLAGWDNVYLMYLDGGNKFTVDNKAQLFIDINDTGSTSVTNKGIHVDIDGTGVLGASQTSTNIGLDIDINRDSGNGHASSTTNTTGIDIDLVGHANGTTTNTGINIAVSAADTNYALITSGGNVGIGVADPDTPLEVLSTATQQKWSYDADSFATIGVDSSSSTSITAAESGNVQLYGNNIVFGTNAGGNHTAFSISSSGSKWTASGGQAYIDATGDIKLDASTGIFHFYDGGDTDDAFKITVAGGTGATTLETVSDAADGHLTLNSDGEINFTPTTEVKSDAPLKIKEAADAVADTAAYGQLWVKTATPNELYFTTDAGDDIQITSGTSIAGGGGGASALNDLSDVAYSSGDLTITSLDKIIAGALEIDSSGDITLDADGDQVTMKFGSAAGQIDFTNANSGDGIIQQKVDTKDLVIQQFDGDEVVRFTDGGDVKITNTVYFAAETANTCDSSGGSASATIDWNASQKQKLTITGTSNTINFTDPAGPCNLILKIVQGDGSDTITAGNYHTNVKWAGGAKPTLSTANGAIDIISFYFDGTSYHGVGSIGFATV